LQTRKERAIWGIGGTFVRLNERDKLAENFGDVSTVYFINEQGVSIGWVALGARGNALQYSWHYLIGDVAARPRLRSDALNEVLIRAN
jgi:hypothetical protein